MGSRTLMLILAALAILFIVLNFTRDGEPVGHFRLDQIVGYQIQEAQRASTEGGF